MKHKGTEDTEKKREKGRIKENKKVFFGVNY
jgi:hypothetical protein